MKYLNKITAISRLVFVGVLVAGHVYAKTDEIPLFLVKCENQAAVYAVDQTKNAKVFPDAQTFFSYGYEFSQVQKISCEPTLPYKLTGTVPNKNGFGFRLMKKQQDPGVFECVYKKSYYQCDKILSEQKAVERYGSNWPMQIYETNEKALDMLVWHWKKQKQL